MGMDERRILRLAQHNSKTLGTNLEKGDKKGRSLESERGGQMPI